MTYTTDRAARLRALLAVINRMDPADTTGTDATDDAAEERKAQREGVYDSEADQDWLAGRAAG